jgi:hypothetical protein
VGNHHKPSNDDARVLALTTTIIMQLHGDIKNENIFLHIRTKNPNAPIDLSVAIAFVILFETGVSVAVDSC